MAFPSPSLSLPTLGLYTFAYPIVGGLTGNVQFGGVASPLAQQALGTNLGTVLDSAQGLDMPPVSSGDVQRPLDQGEFIGLDTSQGRDITVDIILWATTAALLDAECKLIAQVFWNTGTTENPLYVQMPSGLYGMMARPRKGAFTSARLDLTSIQAFGATYSGVFHATDPRIYALPTASATTNLAVPVGGLTFPVTFPLIFVSGGGGSNSVGVLNNGSVEMRPVIVFTGPVTNPVCTDVTASGAPFVGVSLALNTGDTLTIDTDFETVVYRPLGLGTGTSAKYALMSGSTFFNLPPGVSHTYQFTSSDATAVAGTMTVQTASAYAGV